MRPSCDERTRSHCESRARESDQYPVVAIDHVRQLLAALERVDLARDVVARWRRRRCRRRCAARASPSDASRTGYPPAAARCGTRRASRRERAVVERGEDVVLDLQAAAPGIDHHRPAELAVARELRERAAVEDAARLRRQRQQAHQHVGARQKAAEVGRRPQSTRRPECPSACCSSPPRRSRCAPAPPPRRARARQAPSRRRAASRAAHCSFGAHTFSRWLSA